MLKTRALVQLCGVVYYNNVVSVVCRTIWFSVVLLKEQTYPLTADYRGIAVEKSVERLKDA
jgi:hypothetical protein